MHEFHAWVGLSDSPYEDDDARIIEVADELRQLVETADWETATFTLNNLNGTFFLNADGFANRRRDEAQLLDRLLAIVLEKLPGSWGVVYERDDEAQITPGSNAFLARVIARGVIVTRLDPFLSPCNPTIED
jgi:hypothetical protein